MTGLQGNTPKTWLISLATIGLALMAPRLVPRAQAGRPERVGAASAGIRRVDTDGDGQLSRAEHTAAARKLFETMDVNKDGKVTPAEMDAAAAHTKDRRPSRSMKAAKMTAADKIRLNDRDHDGVLTTEEHIAAAIATFEQMDSDKDGRLTSVELAAGHKKILHKNRAH